jgi:hypothetical protein
MRKKGKPEIVNGIPADWDIIRKCRMIMASGDKWPFPEETVQELAKWIIANAPFRKLSGPEIAAMVDYRAVRTKTISRAAEIVCDFLQGRYSLEAILQSHKRYGRTSGVLRDEAAKIEIEDEAMDAADEEMTDGERAELDQVLQTAREKFERLERAAREYMAAKKDIFG